MQIIQRCI